MVVVIKMGRRRRPGPLSLLLLLAGRAEHLIVTQQLRHAVDICTHRARFFDLPELLPLLLFFFCVRHIITIIAIMTTTRTTAAAVSALSTLLS